MKNLIFIGAPGSGKGTQAEVLMKDYGHKHISTGDLLRAEIANKTPIGLKVQDKINKGQLADDRLIFDLIKKNVDLNKHCYIFDGYPRSLEQAQMLEDELFQGRDYLVYFFSVNLEDMIERLTNRLVCDSCNAIYNKKIDNLNAGDTCPKCKQGKLYQREDDKEEVIRDRIMLHKTKSKPILAFFRKLSRLVELDASKSISELQGEVRAYLDID